jgi:hypothetical protein
MTLDTYFHLIWCYFRTNYIIFRNADFLKNTFLKEMFLKGIEEIFWNILQYIKVIRKVRQKTAREPPLFRHIGDESSKTGKKNKVHWASTGHETQCQTEFALSFIFPNAFNQSLLHSYVYCSYKCSQARCIYSWVPVFHTLI